MTKKLFALLALAMAIGLAPAFAQTNLLTSNTTTLGAAQSQTDTTAQFAAVTGMLSAGPANQIQTMFYVDRELEAITLVPTYTGGYVANVQRGISGTPITSHASGATVYFGSPSYFPYGAPSGSCKPPTTYPVYPVIDVATGTLYQCSVAATSTSTGYWISFSPYVSRLVFGAQLTAAATITISAPIHYITGATTITTIAGIPALPPTGGCVRLIPQVTGYTSSTGGNIGLGTTFVANKVLEMCYDPGKGLWFPNY